MSGPRQTTQYTQLRLALGPDGRGASSAADHQGTEPLVATRITERPAAEDQLMEEVCNRRNLEKAWKRVCENKGSPGVDGLTIDDTADYLREHWPTIREQLLTGTYTPQPSQTGRYPKAGRRGQTARRAMYRRSTDSASGAAGAPTAVGPDVFRAQLRIPTGTFGASGRSPGAAYVADGYNYVVDIDLEKFLRVNHDRLMARVAERVSDKRVLTLIRAFLRAGVLEDGLVRPTEEGTPQGGPLSPLLSNLVLDELDKELERRGHRFCRYADDSNIYVRSLRAGDRVMTSVCRFVTTQLRLKVNVSKSAVARPEERKFLGFRITNDGSQRQIAPQAIERFKTRVRELTRRTLGVSVPQLVEKLAPYLIGWRGYFGFCDTPRVLANLDAIRQRLRMYLWRQWQNGRHRFQELRRRGVSKFNAAVAAGSPTGFWRMSGHPAVQQALRNRYFDAIRLPRVAASSNA